MNESRFGGYVDLEVYVRPLGEGGRSTPLRPGARPITRLTDPVDGDVTFGLGELDFTAELRPGGKAIARMWYAPDVMPLVRRYLRQGSTIDLCEGLRVIASAVVIDVVQGDPQT